MPLPSLASSHRPLLGLFLTGLVMLVLRPGLLQRPLAHRVQALSSMAPPPATAASTVRRRTHRVLCYGDSLTAGTTMKFDSLELFPYAPYLQAGLAAAGREDVQVRHLGLPGWTARSMVAAAEEEEQGLAARVRRVRDPGLSVVVILAGTNDLGHGEPADAIAGHVRRLHALAGEGGVPATVAVAIPPSGYTSRDAAARATAEAVNRDLEEYSRARQTGAVPPRTVFVPFPFEYEYGGENWSSDTLHLSARGYQRLGESLVPVVQRLLDELDADEGHP